MEVTLESLGITKEELTERIVKRLADGLLFQEDQAADEDRDLYSYSTESEFAAKLQEMVREKVDAAVTDLASRTVVPQITDIIETFAIQRTNNYGEKRGEPVTFVEYLTSRAEAFMTEQVNSDGKTKEEASGSWYGGKTTRIAYMIDKHLHYSIQSAMHGAIATANASIVEGIKKAVEMKLAEIKTQLSVKLETRT